MKCRSVGNQTSAAWLNPTKRRDESRRGTHECVRHMTLSRFCAALCLLTGAAFAQIPQPNLMNAKFEQRPFAGDLASQIRGTAPAWFGYAIKTKRGDHQSCCWGGSNGYGCRLEGGSGTVVTGQVSNSPIQLEGTDTLAVLLRVENDRVEKIRVFGLECPLDAGGLPFIW